MKKLRNLIAVMAMMSMAAVLTGCGDDDDNDDDNDQPPGNTIVAPLDEAALTAQNKTYTVNIAGQEPITLTFPAAGQYQAVQAGVTETGTISGATRDVNRWTMNVTPAEGAPEGAQAGVLQLDFTANNAGTATFTPTGGTAETGTFTLVEGGGGGDEGGDGGTDRTTLSGKTLQVTYPGGGGEKFQFTDGSNVSYEDGAQTGTYTWDQANARVNVTLNNGNLFTVTIPEGSNAATVVFQQDANAAPQTDTGTYTLQ
jgi:hypothetical protein